MTTTEYTFLNATEVVAQKEEQHEPALNRSLTSMDWLQRLNADYVKSKKAGDHHQEPDSSTCNEEPKLAYFIRPPYSFRYLIQLALEHFPYGLASHAQICEWIEVAFPYYKDDKSCWRVRTKNYDPAHD